MAPDGATADPRHERRDVIIGEFAGRRHFDSILIADGLDELTFVRLSRNEDRSIFAAAHHRVLTVHLQATRARFGVARVAMFRKQRTDLHFKEVPIGFRFRTDRARKPKNQAPDAGAKGHAAW